MIKKSVFEQELINGMHQKLIEQVIDNNLDNVIVATDLLNSAAEILDDMGMIKRSEDVLKILLKIANKPGDPRNISDKHTRKLTPNRMVDNLKDHGTVFNMADDGSILDIDINDTLEIDDSLESEINDFEDERD